MGAPLYMCKNCLKNNEKIPSILCTFPFKEIDTINKYKDKCKTCGSTDIVKLTISVQEVLELLKISKDINFILAMNELKEKDIIEFNLKMSQFKQSVPQEKQSTQSTNIPKCPTCGSTNIKKISAGTRYVSTGLFGLGSSNVGKTMCCNNCGYKW